MDYFPTFLVNNDHMNKGKCSLGKIFPSYGTSGICSDNIQTFLATQIQWIFQVLVIGARDYITPKRRQELFLVILSGKETANWVIICSRSHLFPEPEKSGDHIQK